MDAFVFIANTGLPFYGFLHTALQVARQRSRDFSAASFAAFLAIGLGIFLAATFAAKYTASQAFRQLRLEQSCLTLIFEYHLTVL
jgi:hypothetical protein